MNLMYRDYVSNIIEIGYLKDFIDQKYNLEDLKRAYRKLKSKISNKRNI